MKKQDAVDKAGGVNALAEVFGISPSAVSQWTDELPEGRVWQLRVIRPTWFTDGPVVPAAPAPTTSA